MAYRGIWDTQLTPSAWFDDTATRDQAGYFDPDFVQGTTFNRTAQTTSSGSAVTPTWKWTAVMNSTDGSAISLNSASPHLMGSDLFGTINQGDLLIALLTEVMTSADPGALTLSGFTQVWNTYISVGFCRSALFWKIAGPSETGVYAPGNWGTDAHAHTATLICFQAGTIDPTTPIYGVTGPNNEFYGGTTSTPLVANAVTIANAVDLYVIAALGDGADNHDAATPSGYTNFVHNPQLYGTTTSALTVEELYYRALGAGVQGPVNMVMDQSNIFGEEFRSYSFAIAGLYNPAGSLSKTFSGGGASTPKTVTTSSAPVTGLARASAKPAAASTSPLATMGRAMARALAALSAPVTARQLAMTRAMASTTSPAAVVTKAAPRPAPTQSAVTAQLTRTSGKPAATTTAATTSLLRSIARILAGSGPGAAQLTRSTAHRAAASTTPPASVVATRATLLTLQAAASAQAAIRRALAHVLQAAAAATAMLTRAEARTMQSAGAGAAGLARSLGKPASTSTTPAAAALALRAFLRTLQFSASAQSSTSRATPRAVPAAAAVTTALSRAEARALLFAAATATTTTRSAGKSVKASTSPAAAALALRAFLRAVQFSAAAAVAMSHAVTKPIAVTTPPAGALTRSSTRGVSASASAAPILAKLISRQLPAQSGASAVLAASRAFLKIVQTQSAMSATGSHAIARGMLATAVMAAAIRRTTAHRAQAGAGPAVSFQVIKGGSIVLQAVAAVVASFSLPALGMALHLIGRASRTALRAVVGPAAADGQPSVVKLRGRGARLSVLGRLARFIIRGEP